MNTGGTLARIRSLPPLQPKLRQSTVREIIRLTEENHGCIIIARKLGISHTSVLRTWRRQGLDRARIVRRAQIVEQHTDLAVRIAKSVAHDVPLHMRADLPSVALAELTRLADLWDPERGVAFGAFAQQRIRGACLDSIRRRHYTTATSGEFSRQDSESRSEAAVAEVSVIDQQQRGRARSAAVEAITRLPGRLAVVAWLHYIEQRPIERIAESLGVGASRVSQLHTEALGLMRAGAVAR